MATYIVAFDLGEDADYERIQNRLQELGGVQGLNWVWALRSEASAGAIRGDLENYLKAPPGRIIVAQLSGEASFNIGSREFSEVLRGSG